MIYNIFLFIESLNIALLIFLSIITFNIFNKVKKRKYADKIKKIDQVVSIISDIDFKKIDNIIVSLKAIIETKKYSPNIPTDYDNIMDGLNNASQNSVDTAADIASSIPKIKVKKPW